MEISDSRQIPHQRLRPFFEFWNAQRGRRRWPRRDDITLDDLRAAAANTAFLRIGRPYRNLDSLRFVNVGTAVERATGQHLTGMTVGELLRRTGSAPDFAFCFSEYGLAATEGIYRRLVLPLGAGDVPDALFVVIDLNAVGLALPLPATLRAYDHGDADPARPWPVPALRIVADGGSTPLD